MAHADSVSGLVSVGGSNTYNDTSILFTDLGSVFGTSQGTLAKIGDCDQCVTFPVNPFVFGPGFMSGLPIFTVNENGITVVLDVLTLNSGSGVNSDGDLSLRGTGSLSETGYTASPATFSLTSQFGSSGASVSFSDSAMATAVTPEPQPLVLVGTGLLACMLLVRRRLSSRSMTRPLDAL